MRTLVLILLFPIAAQCQYQSFIQHIYALPHEIPAAIASDYDVNFTTIVKTQQTGSPDLLYTGFFSGKYPILRNNYQRAAIGINYSSYYFNTPNTVSNDIINTTLAYSINTSKLNSIAFGLNIGYQWAKVDLNGITPSGVPEDKALSERSSFETSGSIYWRSADNYGDDLNYLGFSVFGINHYTNNDSIFQGHINILAGFRLITEGKIAVLPKIRYMVSQVGKGFAKIGLDFNYSLSNFSFGTSRKYNSLNFEVNAVTNSGVQIGMQLLQQSYAIGFGYTMNFARSAEKPLSNNAFEFLFVWRKNKGIKPPKMEKWNNPHAEKFKSYKKPIVQKVAQESPPFEDKSEEVDEPDQEKIPAIDLLVNGEVVPVISLGEISGIGFEFNSTRISVESILSINKLADILKADSSYQIVLIGHTDNVGTHRVNQKIAVARSQAMADELIAGGVMPARIIVEGRGEDEPKVSNNTVEGRQVNRRVEFFIIRR